MRDIIQLAMGCLCVVVLSTGDVTAQDAWPLQYDSTLIDSLVADSNNTRTVEEAACGAFEFGDINGNGIAYEIADAAMLAMYFVKGTVAFGSHVTGSVSASDVNHDGLRLGVADLVYLANVARCDPVMYDRLYPVHLDVDIWNGRFYTREPLGAAYVVVSGDVTPTLLANRMRIDYAFDGENTRILVFSLECNSFDGDFLAVSGDIISAEYATDIGQAVVSGPLPVLYGRTWNFPNPFNVSTNITFIVPEEGLTWKLDIYNVLGQLTDSYSGESGGRRHVTWLAVDRPSGVYIYQLQIADTAVTHKMVLLK
jgi:hypothetical protein